MLKRERVKPIADKRSRFRLLLPAMAFPLLWPLGAAGWALLPIAGSKIDITLTCPSDLRTELNRDVALNKLSNRSGLDTNGIVYANVQKWLAENCSG
jgi:hypothetical protein